MRLGRKQTGLFLTFEGTDGAGKSTQIEQLDAWLREQGHKVVRTREPGGCPIGEQIRKVLLDVQNAEMSPIAEAYLYAASRAQHVRQVIQPALEQGQMVICDRFLDSSLAYQGYARGLGMEEIEQLNDWAVEGCMPHRTFLLIMDPAISLNRRETDSEPDRLEREGRAFQQKVYEGFLSAAQAYPERIMKIDASRSIQAIQTEIRTEVIRLLGCHEPEGSFC